MIGKHLLGIPVPQIVTDRGLHNLFEESHTIASWLLAALLLVHVAGTLRHHFFKRNDVLRRMWTGGATN